MTVPQMLSIEDIAKETGLSKYAVRMLALSGTVAAFRVGRGKILINVDSVAEYLSNARLTDAEPDPHAKSGIHPVTL